MSDLPEYVRRALYDQDSDIYEYCDIHKREYPVSNWRLINRCYARRSCAKYPVYECVCNIHSQELFEQDEELRYEHTRNLRDQEWEAYQKVRSEPKKKVPDQSEGAGRWYAATFTRPDTERSPAGVLKSTQRLLKSKQISALQWCYSLELTASGTPHSHIYFFSNKYFDYKKAGAFNDGFRYDIQPARFGESYANYLAKMESKPTLAWLLSYGLEGWFWSSENYSGPRPEINSVTLDIEECPVVLPAVRSTLAANVSYAGAVPSNEILME